jgi:hypothetical protein
MRGRRTRPLAEIHLLWCHKLGSLTARRDEQTLTLAPAAVLCAPAAPNGGLTCLLMLPETIATPAIARLWHPFTRTSADPQLRPADRRAVDPPHCRVSELPHWHARASLCRRRGSHLGAPPRRRPSVRGSGWRPTRSGLLRYSQASGRGTLAPTHTCAQDRSTLVSCTPVRRINKMPLLSPARQELRTHREGTRYYPFLCMRGAANFADDRRARK